MNSNYETEKLNFIWCWENALNNFSFPPLGVTKEIAIFFLTRFCRKGDNINSSVWKTNCLYKNLVFEFVQQCLYVCMSVCLYVCMSVCLYVCMSVCLYVCMSVCLYVSMSVCLLVCMSVCLLGLGVNAIFTAPNWDITPIFLCRFHS